ncbi:hypothetical protein GCM10027271_51800 [Saccharopolyspora gloriosae]|uniref:DUF2157 domain-containing protein n=1 Tax=Saccharopolyspora gloriosae TaxID=455344 RepID=A0A840NEA8_9PSEU|nr:DUF2157 domain-containing protein [Saccharopolyspora gloriosae]MBB5068558.1 hypothetical protein [Saccharopolyspora gloriosae]
MSAELPPRQRRALERLVERGTLTTEQSEAVAAELSADTAPQRPGGLWEVLGYAGGALVLGGASLLLGMSWEDLSRTARVGMLAAATALLVAAGIFIARSPRGVRALAVTEPSRRSRIVAVLFALASGTTAMAVGSGLDHLDSLNVAMVATGAGLLVAAVACAALPSVPGLLATGGFAYGFVLSLPGDWIGGEQIPEMVLLIALGAAWAALSAGGILERPARDRAGRIRREVGFGIGAATALSGAQWTVIGHQSWSYATTFVLAVLCFAAFLRLRSTVLLVFGVLGVTVAVPEALYDWTGGALGGPLIVLLVGAVLLTTGGLGLRLRNRLG